VLSNERSGSGPDLFLAGRFIPAGRPGLVGRGACGAGADARAWLVSCAVVFAKALCLNISNDYGSIVTSFCLLHQSNTKI